MELVKNLEKTTFLNNGRGKADVDALDFIKSLEDLGYSKITESKGFTLVRTEGNIIRKVQPHEIADTVREHLKAANRISELRAVLNNTGLFGRANLQQLPTREFQIQRDHADQSFLYFRNGFVSITTEGVQLHSYEDLEGYIWEEQIIDRDFRRKEELGAFEQFITNIGAERLQTLKSALGYLLHDHKTGRDHKAVILMDMNSGLGANGGTGKSLVARALSEMREMITMDGKNIKPGADKFLFQNVDETTKILFLDDVPEKFDMENIYSAIATGIQVEQKYKPRRFIKHEDAFKFLIATNDMAKGPIGASTQRRKFEVEISDYYGLHRTPYDEFGHIFFDDYWGRTEWNRFYSFMVRCIQLYLQKGLI